MTSQEELPPAQAAVLAELGDMFVPTQRIAERGRGKWSVSNTLGFLRELERKGLAESEQLDHARGQGWRRTYAVAAPRKRPRLTPEILEFGLFSYLTYDRDLTMPDGPLDDGDAWFRFQHDYLPEVFALALSALDRLQPAELPKPEQLPPYQTAEESPRYKYRIGGIHWEKNPPMDAEEFERFCFRLTAEQRAELARVLAPPAPAEPPAPGKPVDARVALEDAIVELVRAAGPMPAGFMNATLAKAKKAGRVWYDGEWHFGPEPPEAAAERERQAVAHAEEQRAKARARLEKLEVPAEEAKAAPAADLATTVEAPKPEPRPRADRACDDFTLTLEGDRIDLACLDEDTPCETCGHELREHPQGEPAAPVGARDLKPDNWLAPATPAEDSSQGNFTERRSAEDLDALVNLAPEVTVPESDGDPDPVRVAREPRKRKLSGISAAEKDAVLARVIPPPPAWMSKPLKPPGRA